MATKKTPIADAARGMTSTKPARKKAATPPTVAAKGKRGFAALAEGIPGLRSAAPAAKTAKKRTDAIAVAGAAMVKTTAKDAAASTMPQHVVKNLKGLREAMDKYPKATGYSTDRKFGIDAVNLHNTRGRIIAEIKLIAKK